MEREYLNKFGRPLLGATIKPKLGLSAATMVAWCMKRCAAGWTSARTMRTSTATFMRWRDRFLFCMEAVNRAMAVTGEIKGLI